MLKDQEMPDYEWLRHAGAEGPGMPDYEWLRHAGAEGPGYTNSNYGPGTGPRLGGGKVKWRYCRGGGAPTSHPFQVRSAFISAADYD